MSVEFEYVIINKLLNSGEFFNRAMPVLQPKFFEDIGCAEALKLIKSYYAKYNSNATITEIISMVGSVETESIRLEIKKSLTNVYSVEESKNLEFLLDSTVDFIKDSMYLEALRIGSDGLSQRDPDKKAKAKEIMDDMAKVTIDTDLGLDFDDIQKMIEYYQERNIGILTRNKEMNKRLGTGFLPGTLTLIMAASGIGKSLLMTDLVSDFIIQGKNSLLISLEMGDKEIMKRVHANAMDLPINSLIDLSKTPEELAAIKKDDPGHEFVSREIIEERYAELKAKGTTGKLFIKDFPSGSFSALMLEALVQSYAIIGVEFDAIFVDYVGICKSDVLTPNVGLYSYIKSIVEEFRASSRRLGVPIISANQLNRGATNNIEDADNSNAADSMGAVMTADLIMFLLQNEEMKERNEITAKCTKNRFNGRTDSWMMNVDYTRMRFSDMINESEVETYSGSGTNQKAMSDFGIVTAEKYEAADKFANAEIKSIEAEALTNIDSPVPGTEIPDPMADLMASLMP